MSARLRSARLNTVTNVLSRKGNGIPIHAVPSGLLRIAERVKEKCKNSKKTTCRKKNTKGEKVRLKRFQSKGKFPKINIKFISIPRKVNNKKTTTKKAISKKSTPKEAIPKKSITKKSITKKSITKKSITKKSIAKKSIAKSKYIPMVILRRIPKGMKRRPLIKARVKPSLAIQRPKIKVSVKANVSYRHKKVK